MYKESLFVSICYLFLIFPLTGTIIYGKILNI